MSDSKASELGKRAIVLPAHAEIRDTYRHSSAVEVGNVLYLSGQTGWKPDWTPIDDPRDQTVAAFENVKAVLESAGYTFGDVVDLMSYHTSFDDFQMFCEVKDRYILGPEYPAWTAVEVNSLISPGFIVELKCVAVRAG